MTLAARNQPGAHVLIVDVRNPDHGHVQVASEGPYPYVSYSPFEISLVGANLTGSYDVGTALVITP